MEKKLHGKERLNVCMTRINAWKEILAPLRRKFLDGYSFQERQKMVGDLVDEYTRYQDKGIYQGARTG